MSRGNIRRSRSWSLSGDSRNQRVDIAAAIEQLAVAFRADNNRNANAYCIVAAISTVDAPAISATVAAAISYVPEI